MITLFPHYAKVFTTQGLGVLSTAASCTVEEERNGMYELTMQYPIYGIHYEDIKLRSILVTKPNKYDKKQAFRIYKISKPINGLVTINARHISYDLSGIPVRAFTASDVVSALNGLKTHSIISNPFTFTTDKSTLGEFILENPQSCRSLLGGQQGSILDIYGGEYYWDNYNIHLKASRGQDTGFTIRYGKNMVDCTEDEDCSESFTGVVGYYKSEEVYVESDVQYDANRTYNKVLTVDFSSDYGQVEVPVVEEDDEGDIIETTEIQNYVPTKEELNEAARQYLINNKLPDPTVSISLNFAELSQSEEYKHLNLLESVNLCDTVHVIFNELGVNVTAKVVKTVWNVLTEKYDRIEIGDPKTNISDTIAEQQKEIEENDVDVLKASMDKAVKLVTGNLGGYVILHDSNNDGYPDELLILNTPDIQTATNVWRFNQNGLMHANSYSGQYANAAITMDGQINADAVTTGVMSANRVRTGTISSMNGNCSINLDNETITFVNASNQTVLQFNPITGLTVVGDGTFSGTLQAVNGTFTNLSAGGSSYFCSNYIHLDAGSSSGKLYIGDATDYGYSEVSIYNPDAGGRTDSWSNCEGNVGTGEHSFQQVVAEHIYCRQNHTDSSIRFKENVHDLDDSLYDIDKIRPVMFNYKKRKETVMGFIAEECIETAPTAVCYSDGDSQPDSLDYNQFIPIAIKEIQNLRKRVKDLEENK